MDPALYDEEQHRAQLLRQMRASEAIVYAAAFAPESVSSEPLLVAATSTGELHVFLLRPMLEPTYWEHVTEQRETTHPGPNLSFQAHPTQIYSVAFAGDDATPLLITGGDQDFRVWRWADIATALSDPLAPAPAPLHVAQLERKTMGFRGALLPFNEVNDIAVARAAGRVFFAGGDSLAHEWDPGAQAFVRQFAGHGDYVHALRHLAHARELVTCAEDGAVGLWDARQARALEFLRPAAPGGAPLWLGCAATDASEVWLAAGGGRRRAPGQPQAGGFLGMWHLPSRVPVHASATPSDVHAAAFHRTELLTAGNDASLRQWNRSSGALLAAARASVPASHFCVVDAATDIVAVGGQAPLIDVYAMPGVVSFSLLVEAPQLRQSCA